SVITNRIWSLRRSDHSDDQTTSEGRSARRTFGSTSSSTSTSHWRPPGRRGSTSVSQRTAGGGGCVRSRAPSSITDRPYVRTHQGSTEDGTSALSEERPAHQQPQGRTSEMTAR